MRFPSFATLIQEEFAKVKWSSRDVTLLLSLLQNLSQEPQIPIQGCGLIRSARRARLNSSILAALT
jgi:hypothetical protein